MEAADAPQPARLKDVTAAKAIVILHMYEMTDNTPLQRDGAWLHRAVAAALREGRGLAVGKLGTAEFQTMLCHVSHRGSSAAPKQQMFVNAGLWPATDSTIADWQRCLATEVLPNMDAIVAWNEPKAFEEAVFRATGVPTGCRRICLRALEPFYQSEDAAMWSQAIPAGTTVAVVSPFSASVAKQIPQLAALFPRPIWPVSGGGLVFETVQTGCSPALDMEGPAVWPPDVFATGWRGAVADVVERVVTCGARVAVVGCGALSLPICTALKARGVVAIHTGGATQVLFGIRGARWTQHSVISKMFNEHWITPSPAETPQNHTRVEGGCYW